MKIVLKFIFQFITAQLEVLLFWIFDNQTYVMEDCVGVRCNICISFEFRSLLYSGIVCI